MFTAFRFGIPAVYGEVGGPPIRAPHNPAPIAANNPPHAVEADDNPPIQIPPNHHDENDGGNLRIGSGRLFLLYFFGAFVIVRLWMLVVAADNDVYTALAIVAMAVGLVAYCRWRQRYLYEINEALMNRPHNEIRDIPIESIHEFLLLQAAMRRVTALNQHRLNNLAGAGTVVPTDDSQHTHSTSLLIASLPSIVYETSTGSRPASAAQRPQSQSNHDITEIGEQRPLWSRQSSMSLDIEAQQAPSQPRSTSQAPGAGGSGVAAMDKDTMCMVCLADFVPGEIITVLPCACGHKYHRSCIAVWLGRKNSCPLCCTQLIAPPSNNAATNAAGGDEPLPPQG